MFANSTAVPPLPPALQSGDEYREIFDASPDPICITLLSNWRIVLVNREFERATGFTLEEARGRTPVELGLWCNPTEQERCFRLMQVHGELRNLPMTMRLRDGSERPCLISASNIRLNGEPCTMTVARDIAEMRRIEAELTAARDAAEAASRAKSEFLSSMSHEIRTPMNAIMGMVELLAETPLNSEQRRYVGLMRSNGAALLALINDALDLARIERGLLDLESAEFDLVKVVDSVVETLGLRAAEKGLRLGAAVAPEVAAERIGDALRLRQILINLVGNAIKFTERGEVTVQVLPHEGDLLHFAVRDTGIGIPADRLEDVFRSFTQADSSTARRYGGSGLGLAIVTRLVELMGGRVWVESQVGVGSTFHFSVRLPSVEQRSEATLPAPSTAATPQPTPLDAAAVAEAALAAGRPLSVLVVDDSVDNRFLLKALLKRFPFSITEAENGSEAVAMARLSHFDVILMDMRMPVMDGIAATRAIREWETRARLAPTPIIALTASALHEDVAECLAAGCDVHVSKPISKRTLYEAMARATSPGEGPDSPHPGRTEPGSV
ncbi:MAG TPA: ATP-binding protein [Candidatus Binataceae bacterium]|nr:ATP-binding protein [Candidatus Binataceae bacterium]